MTIETKTGTLNETSIDPNAKVASGENAGGNAGGTNEAKTELSELETLKLENAKIKAKNDEILAEKKELAKRIKDSESKQSEAEKLKAQQDNDFKKLYEIAQAEMNRLKTDVEERELKEAEMSKKVLREKQISAFKSNLGAELVSDDFLKLVDWDKFVVDPSVKDTIQFNSDGVKQAVEGFKTKYGASVLKPNAAQVAEAAKGKASGSGDTFAERAKKAGLI
jgi:hypothetical protein